MQRSVFVASLSACVVVMALASPVWAGFDRPPAQSSWMTAKYNPVSPEHAPRGSTRGTAIQQPLIVIPVRGFDRTTRILPGGFVEPAMRSHPQPERSALRPIRPISVSPVGDTIASRLPSGRISIGAAPGAYVASPRALAYYKRLQHPYAPPAFHMIGAPSGRHMAKAVALTYGVQPERRRPMGPNVIWVGDTQQDTPHVRRIKP
jgi:hypothetical protein